MPKGLAAQLGMKREDTDITVSRASSNGGLVCGDQTGSLAIHTDDPKMPVVAVPVLWSIPGNFAVTPNSVQLGIVQAGKKIVVNVTIKNADRSFLLNGLQIEHVPPGLVARLSTVAERNGKPSEIGLALEGTLKKGGLIDDTLTLRTSDPREPVISIPIVGAGNNGDVLDVSGAACIAPTAPRG